MWKGDEEFQNELLTLIEARFKKEQKQMLENAQAQYQAALDNLNSAIQAIQYASNKL